MQALHTADGLPLHLRQWAVPGPARGTVLLVHGLGEHIGRYAHVAEALNTAGWQVLGYDHRGHGASGGARGALATPHSLLQDLGRVLDAVHPQAGGTGTPGATLVLLGHSMGGLVAARYVAEGLAAAPAPWYRKVDALVLSSPALDPGMNPVQKLLLALLGPLAPHLALGNGLNPAWVSRDAAVVQAYTSDPLVHDRITPALVRFIVDGGRTVRAAAPRWSVPTLLQYAGADRCVAPAGSATFAAAAPAAVLHTLRYDGLAHEIYNEPERATVLADLTHWLSHRSPP